MSTPMNGSRDAAGLLPMSGETRGHAIEKRANALGIYKARELERATGRVDRMVRRDLIGKAFRGQATDTTYQRLEDALTLLEEETGHDEDDDARVFEWHVSSQGISVTFKAPVENREEAEESALRLIREMKADT